MKNATIEGVRDKVEILTQDARSMSFADDTFDLILSSWALHNIPSAHDREKALSEIVRVTKPGGTIAILDIQCANEYEAYFTKQGLTVVKKGPRYTFGIPTYFVQATKQKP